MAGFIALAAIAHGQSPAPLFTADQVLPSGRAHPTPLAPGMLMSIYGRYLGPEHGCEGQAETRSRETPNPRRPRQSFAETLTYPKELCGVHVLIGDNPAGLLYVQEKQINFKVPQDIPLDGTAQLKVSYQGRSNSPVQVPLGLDTVTLSLEGVARVGSPVWVRIELPYGWGRVQYPVGIHPADFGCHEIEVRRNGALLPRTSSRAAAGTGGGLPCGNIGIVGHPMKHPGRLPLHLQYRLEKPGVYEVRYTRKGGEYGPANADVLLRSAWTPIEVLAPERPRRGPLPQDPAEILSDFLPGILGFQDTASLSIVLEYLYHSNDTVRRYAALGLVFWPEEEVDSSLLRLIRTRGPSDVVVDRIIHQRAGLIDVLLPHLRSENPVLLRGAINGVSRLLSNHREFLPAGADARAGTALISALEHIIGVGDEQTRVNFAAALGAVRGERGREALWDLVKRRVALEQSLIAITWRKDPRDLQRLGEFLQSAVTSDTFNASLSSLPGALRNAFGEAALPSIESALKNSGNAWVQTNCARELVLAGRPAGFTFILQAIEQNRIYKREMIDFLRGHFPQLRGAGEAAVLAFLKHAAP